MEKTRIDKWLWTVRIFKSRSMATQACKSGKVKVNNAKCKPARPIGGGEHISVDKNGLKLQFKILEILKSRVAYAIAKDCYEDLTPAEEREKFELFTTADVLVKTAIVGSEDLPNATAGP